MSLCASNMRLPSLRSTQPRWSAGRTPCGAAWSAEARRRLVPECDSTDPRKGPPARRRRDRGREVQGRGAAQRSADRQRGTATGFSEAGRTGDVARTTDLLSREVAPQAAEDRRLRPRINDRRGGWPVLVCETPGVGATDSRFAGCPDASSTWANSPEAIPHGTERWRTSCPHAYVGSGH